MATLPRIPGIYYKIIAAAIGFMVTWQLFYSYQACNLSATAYSTPPGILPTHMASAAEIRAAIRTLNQPSIPASAKTFTTNDGKELNIKGDILWKEPLGEDLCIIDLDDRPFGDGKWGKTFESKSLDWKNTNGRLVGVLNHFEYASIHGYKYYYVRTKKPEDRRATWKKPSVIRKILQNHKLCIYMDSDAMFNHIDMPFEFMLNYWTIKPNQTSLSLAYDPAMDWNKDWYGKVYLNSGFIIAQNLARTDEILTAWDTCPDSGPGRFENCSQFKTSYPLSDQAAFGNLIRYAFNETDDINALPCEEANGQPAELEAQGCDGEFIKHFWSHKDTNLPVIAGQALSGALLRNSYETFLYNRKDFLHMENQLDRLPSGRGS